MLIRWRTARSLWLPPAPRDGHRDLASLKFESEHTPQTQRTADGTLKKAGLLLRGSLPISQVRTQGRWTKSAPRVP